MENARRYVNQLKLRGSWGKLGNQNIGTSYYPFAETLAVGGISMAERVYQLVTLNTMSNPDPKWAETNMTGVGLDATLLYRYQTTAEWYARDIVRVAEE